MIVSFLYKYLCRKTWMGGLGLSGKYQPFIFIFLLLFSHSAAAAAAKSLQSCPTLCDPIDGSQPGSPVPGILQARTLEWVAISFSNAWKWKVKVKLLSPVQLLVTPWTNVKPILYPWNEPNLVIMCYPWPSFLYLAWFSLLICVCLCYF